MAAGLIRALSFSRQEVALIGITVLWGATFLAVHTAMRHSGPWYFVGVRFLTAALVSVLFLGATLRRVRPVEVVAGVAIGAALFAGYGLQTVGLQTIDSSTSAFITALYVPMVPLLQWAIFRKLPRRMNLIGAGLAFLGLLALSGPSASGLRAGFGEAMTAIAAIAIAAEILLIGFFAGRVNFGPVTVIQLLVASVLGFVAMPFAGESIPAFSWGWAGPALALGAASYLIQLTMNWAQRSVSPTRATIIYAGEPVWGGVFGRLAGDQLPPLALLGAALIVGGTLVGDLGSDKDNPDRAERKSAARTEPDDPGG